MNVYLKLQVDLNSLWHLLPFAKSSTVLLPINAKTGPNLKNRTARPWRPRSSQDSRSCNVAALIQMFDAS